MRAARIARALWLVWAVLLWNVVFDHVIVVAGREYIVAAKQATATVPVRYANMDDWMRPAVTRGLWVATGSAGLVLASGVILLRVARARAIR
jgi:CTP:molybdopterin cytidylyltransferase MocA